MSLLQDLVDELAVELGRPVGVDDRRFRALAYSAHDNQVDSVRRDSILRREAPRPVTEWLVSLGIEKAPKHVLVPANPEYDMAARICVPLRFDDALLGYLWLLGEPETRERSAIALAERYGEQLAAELARLQRLEGAEREHQSQALQRLLFGPDPHAAAAELAAEEVLAGARSFVALVARGRQPGSRGAGGPDHATRVHLSLAAEELRRGVSSNHALALAHQSEVVVVLAFEDPGEPLRRAAALGDACRAHLRSAGEEARRATVVVGVGEPSGELSGLRESCRQAQIAARVGGQVARFGTGAPVAWGDLGSYRTVVELLGDRAPEELLPRALADLEAERDGPSLIETVETYLDLGGDAKLSAERLFLHRSSLYKRLARIERLTGLDMRSGEDRLDLHLGLRLWRLTGAGRKNDERSDLP